MITLANIRRSVYNLFKRVEGIEEFLFQFVTDWADFKEEGIVANQAFPETWHKTGVLNNLIQDINADDTATTGKVYTATVSFNDLPSNMLQAELKVEIKEDSGKVILFTLISNETSPYYWLGISSYSGEVVWKSFLTEHQDISGKANSADLATVATTGDYEDLINKPSALSGKSAYDIAVDNGFEGTEQEWLASLKGEDGQLGLEGPAGQDGAPGLDGHSPVVTASKSGSTTTIYVDGTSIATIEDGLDGQDGLNGTNGTNGLDGQDGHTPVITASKSNGVTTVSVDGTAIATINDGQDGSNGTNGTNGTDGNDGTDGITPTVTVTSISNGHNVAFSYGTGDSRNTNFNVMDGNVANQLQADWNLSDNTQADYIKNKPDTSKLLQNPIDANGHTYVEIAGIKWATMNIGAESETDYGLYFQWADTQGYTYLQVASGQKLFGPGKSCVYIDDSIYGYTVTKYNSTDNKTILDLSDDAVRANWGGSWRMPTRAECEALASAVNTSWTSNYNNSGIAGHICTDKTDSSKTLFFPAGGFASNLTYTTNSNNISAFETQCCYWTSDLDPETDSAALDFGGIHYGMGIGTNAREAGLLIRGVLDINTDLLAKVAITGSYNDLTNKPTIPSSPDLTNYVLKSQTSGLLKNDGTVDTSTYLTSHLDISGKANTADLADVATSGSYDDLTDTPNAQIFACIQRVQYPYDYGYVDLGLPSGTLWQNGCVNGYGYEYVNTNSTVYKGDPVQNYKYDKCNYHLGGKWHTPTKQLFEELLSWKSGMSISRSPSLSGLDTIEYTITLYKGSKNIKFRINHIYTSPTRPNKISYISSTKNPEGGYYALTFTLENTSSSISIISADITTITTPDHYVYLKGVLDYYPEIIDIGVIDANSHTYVDLGLPSGTLWADKNIGASSITDTGNVYSALDERLNAVNKPKELWGGSWHMPSVKQLEELLENTTLQFTLDGCKFIGLNNNYIIVPYYSSTSGGIGCIPSRDRVRYSASNYVYEELKFYDQQNVIFGTTSGESLFNIRPVLDGAPTIISNVNNLATVATSGSYNDLTDKPTIPSAPDLTNYVLKSSTSGLLKNDGTVDTNTYLTLHQSLTDYVLKSLTSGLLKNDGTIDTSTYIKTPVVDANNHNYVDLGLPSGTLWATMNVGASSEEDYGNYYMYGKGSTLYDSSDSVYTGTETPLSLSVDTARQIMGGSWHMPTKALFEELIANTTYEWVTTSINGGGYKFTSANGNYIFLPAAGYYYNETLSTGSGNYYSSTPDTDNYAYTLEFYNGYEIVHSEGRNYGYSIRGVLDHVPMQAFKVSVTGSYNDLTDKPTIPDVSGKANSADLATVATSGSYTDLSNQPSILSLSPADSNNHTYVDLGLPSGTLWATTNIGASSLTDIGNYYAYGKGNSQHNGSDSVYSGVESPLSLSVDTARQVWSGDWHTPTKEQYEELIAYTTYTFEYNFNSSGVNGAKFTASNGNYIFLPASGYLDDNEYLHDSTYNAYYLTSSSYNSNKSYCLLATVSNVSVVGDVERKDGRAVRGVLNTISKVSTTGSYNDLLDKPTIPTKTSDLENDCNFLNIANYGIDQNLYVDMGLPSGTLWAKKSIDVTLADGFAESEYLYECSFFSWGNTDGHNPTSTSSFEPYSFGSSNSEDPYASSEGAKINYPGSVGLSNDAAHITLGGLWRTPAVEDFMELFNSNYTKFVDASGNDIASDVKDKRVTINSIVGIRLKSKVNGNTIFFPCSGYGTGSSWYYRGLSGFFWSASLSSASYGHRLLFGLSGVYPQHDYHRYGGFSVRPIISTKFAISDVAITGDYNDLINKPTIPTIPSNETAASGGTTLSVVTTGEKYTWNNKANVWRGTQAQYDLLTPDSNTIYIITSAS